MSFEDDNLMDRDKVSDRLTCTGCGAVLKFNPGTTNLKCEYCGAENAIEAASPDEVIEEVDYEKFINEKLDQEEKIEVVSVRCDACGAAVTLAPHVTSDQCPYCASNIVLKSGSTSSMLKPKSLLPFEVDARKASELFRNWVDGLWFAPNDLKKANVANEKLNGIYVPYWTYDADTQTWYTGQRGDYYYVTESYSTEEDGQTVTRTREVQKTRWTSVSGDVNNEFDDVLVVASHSLPKSYTDALEPWNLDELVPYNDKYLSGFRSETYQVDVKTGLEEAKDKMRPVIQSTICDDIGGDKQQVTTMNTTYDDITFKHVLLPIWISSYRFKSKVFRFLVNGQTGEVQGERPYSAWKIFFAVLLALIAIIVIVVLTQK